MSVRRRQAALALACTDEVTRIERGLYDHTKSLIALYASIKGDIAHCLITMTVIRNYHHILKQVICPA
jgi:hypothetical protein